MKLSDSVTVISGVGEQLGSKLSAIGVKTVGELINYYPRRYNDFSNVLQIAEIRPGEVSVKAQIKQVRGRYVRRGMHITEAVASDKSGSVRLVWFNQPYRANAIKPNTDYFISGQFELSYRRLSIMNPSMELVSSFPISTARIVPIYPETKGLKSLQIRKALRTVSPVITKLPEVLPAWLIKEQNLLSRNKAIEAIHFPKTNKMLDAARKRLGFEEVFELSLASLLNKYELSQEHSISIPFNEKLAKDFVSHLPFKLTDAQRKVVWQIYKDLEKTAPMNRILEGDVGSGKTVVAVMSALMAMEQGWQVALMAPTELLANQHFNTVRALLEPLGHATQVGLLVGSLKSSQKLAIHEQIRNGEIKLIIGTHALIADKVDMHKLGLVIIDEQHRFGVEQRKKLQAKAGHALHVLNMTATPIPRSLALTLYGEMDISVIDEKPTNRLLTLTKLVAPSARGRIYETVKNELKSGRQMFVVTPLISESEILDVKSAEKTLEQINKDFYGFRIGLLHGRLKTDEKAQVMQKFVSGKLDILVSTTVIEVGVDVPNATVMLVENPERFGLAQIHQLRGRIGRSHHQGYCYLLLDGNQPPSQRLKALENTDDGFKLAELDLEIRGPGAIYGTFQHGQLDLRIAKLTDTKLIAQARNAAQEFIDKDERLGDYKELSKKVTALRAVTNLN
ncbi:MAG TPA: ATP-dependent DNA helicase RecG [Candidatus Saccharimonadales bacterium]|nr:ATP-dependent DNA helicase RecG [Candidatus Saccharimonadales bacterium]